MKFPEFYFPPCPQIFRLTGQPFRFLNFAFGFSVLELEKNPRNPRPGTSGGFLQIEFGTSFGQRTTSARRNGFKTSPRAQECGIVEIPGDFGSPSSPVPGTNLNSRLQAFHFTGTVIFFPKRLW